MTDQGITCASRVSWWDGEYEGECELPEDHEGPHTDGLSHWDDDGEEIKLAHRGQT
jgi:hypothetical protein